MPIALPTHDAETHRLLTSSIAFQAENSQRLGTLIANTRTIGTATVNRLNELISTTRAIGAESVALLSEHSEQLEEHTIQLHRLIESVERIEENVATLTELVAKLIQVRPATPTIKPEKKGQTEMGMKFDITMGAVNPADKVGSRELTTTVNGGEPAVATYPAETTLIEGVVFPEDSDVVLSLVDIDSSAQANRSEAAVYSFKAIDDVPPATPSGLGVVSQGQVPD